MEARVCDLGRMDYKSCWELQQKLFDDVLRHKATIAEAMKGGGGDNHLPFGCGRRPSYDALLDRLLGSAPSVGSDSQVGTILLVEHPPVYTLGKSGHAENLLIGREALEKMGAQFFHIDRGGDITFHGPGQLVCYPILDLEAIGIGLRDYIAILEEAVIGTVSRWGIEAGRIAGASGVWIDQPGRPPRKICAIGVRASRSVVMHGFALNVTTDLGWFARINPCGFTDRDVTSIQAEAGCDLKMEEVKALVVKFLSEKLNVKIYNY